MGQWDVGKSWEELSEVNTSPPRWPPQLSTGLVWARSAITARGVVVLSWERTKGGQRSLRKSHDPGRPSWGESRKVTVSRQCRQEGQGRWIWRLALTLPDLCSIERHRPMASAPNNH